MVRTKYFFQTWIQTHGVLLYKNLFNKYHRTYVLKYLSGVNSISIRKYTCAVEMLNIIQENIFDKRNKVRNFC